MKKLLLFSLIFLILSCKKENVEPSIHIVQFQSNINSIGIYELSINGVPQLIENTYNLQGNIPIVLKLTRSDSTKWLIGAIYLDGKAAKYDAGYKDFDLILKTE